MGSENRDWVEKKQPVKAVSSVKKNLVRDAGLLGIMTLASRVCGMIRDIVSAKRFGTTWQWDAFVYSFMLPNFFRRIVGEGALSSAFIPIYSETLEQQGKERAFRLANLISTILSVSLAAFILLAEVLFYFLLKAHFLPERFQLTVHLLRYMFPYLWFMSLYALSMGVLNCHHHFFMPSLGPVILDLFWIAGVLWIPPMFNKLPEDQLNWLAVVVLVSGLVQFGVQLPQIFRLGFRIRWIWDVFDAGVQKIRHLVLPSILSFAIVQINLLVDTTLGFLIGPGANSSLWYGTRLMQFPLGVFAITMGTALLPMISRQAARGDLAAANKSISFALRSVFLIILPCTVGLIVLKTPIVRFLFERGEFDAVSTARSAGVLMCCSFGLFAYSGQKIIATGFYAIQDPRTPVKMGIVALVSNIVLNLILMRFLAEAGLALATSLAGILQFGLLLRIYGRRVSDFPFWEIFRSFAKILAASLAMGVACLWIFHGLERFFSAPSLWDQTACVFGAMFFSTLLYILFCMILRVHEMNEALQWILSYRKRKKSDQAESLDPEISE